MYFCQYNEFISLIYTSQVIYIFNKYRRDTLTENKKLLGKRIKQIRKNAGFTQEKLSELIGIETGSLSTIESGRSFPSLVTLEKISQILNVEMKAFFDYDTSITIKDMKKIIVKNIDKIKENQIHYIYKYFEGLNQ